MEKLENIDTRLTGIERRTHAAELGPWGTELYPPDGHLYMLTDHEGMPLDLYLTNAEFIAHARTDLPQVTAALRTVFNLHQLFTKPSGTTIKSVDGLDYCVECHQLYPCPTVQTIASVLTQQV